MMPCVQAFEPLFRRLAEDYEIKEFEYPEALSLPEREEIKGHRDLPEAYDFYSCTDPDTVYHVYSEDADDLLDFSRKWPKTKLIESGLPRLIRELLVLVDDSAVSGMDSLMRELEYTLREIDTEYRGDEEDGDYYWNRAVDYVDENFAYEEGAHLRKFDAYMDSQ